MTDVEAARRIKCGLFMKKRYIYDKNNHARL